MSSNQRWVLGLTAVASLMVLLDALVVSNALSTMRVDLHASLAQLDAQPLPSRALDARP